MTDIMQKYGLLIPNINPCDETFMELLPQIICNFHDTNVNWKERKNNPVENPYLILKQQLETILTERNAAEIEEVMLKSENQNIPAKELFDNPQNVQMMEAANIRFLERIYFEIYKDDPEFKHSLILTPIDKLLGERF